MKRVLFLLPLSFLLACNNNTKSLSKPFTTSMLASQLFSVDPGKDTSLHTVHGSIIHIAAGSFNSKVNVEIQVREAFTPAELLASGLTTESNGRPLRSGGMIYVNATAGGDSVELLKPLSVSVPNPYYDSAMQVFKGIDTGNGNINWIDPQPVDTTPQSKSLSAGKTLFESHCASCHRIFSDQTGPMLADVDVRWQYDMSALGLWIRNWMKAVRAGYAQALRAQQWAPTSMPLFETMTDPQLDDLLAYIKNESKKPAPRTTETNGRDSTKDQLSPDTTFVQKKCPDDTVYFPVTKADRSFFTVDTANYDYPDTVSIDSYQPSKPEDLENLRNGFTDPNPTAGMYDFEIKTFGWYNIDAYVEGYQGTSNVKLWAQVHVDFDIDLHVYLFCPDRKMLSVGYEKQGNNYFFNKINGGLPLFLNDRAILFAFGSKNDKLYYGLREFLIQSEQTVEIKLHESTENEIKRALFSKQMNGIDLGIDLGIEKKEMRIIEDPCDKYLGRSDTTISPK